MAHVFISRTLPYFYCEAFCFVDFFLCTLEYSCLFLEPFCALPRFLDALHSFHFFRHVQHSFFCLYRLAHLLHSHCAFFSCSQMRASGTAINSASAAQVMLFCLFSDKCFKCENRKLLINKRHKKSQFQLSTNEKKEFHWKMSGTLEMLPFISRNKSLSHSRGRSSSSSSPPPPTSFCFVSFRFVFI